MQDWQDLESFWRATGIATALDESVTQEGEKRCDLGGLAVCGDQSSVDTDSLEATAQGMQGGAECLQVCL